MRRKKGARSGRWPLFLLAVIILGGIWLASQAARLGAGPTWFQALMGAPRPAGGAHIGIIAGHRGNDSGTVCDDGLTETQVNQAVAEQVAVSLRGQGVSVDVLDEYDRRLRNYRADALVSIHSDSCSSALSGFKVSPPVENGSPADERLAACLWDRYQAATGLARHPDTITRDMTHYHAFDEINDGTPAVIIEIGFLGGDRELLTGQSGRVVAGITDGLFCFLAPGAVR